MGFKARTREREELAATLRRIARAHGRLAVADIRADGSERLYERVLQRFGSIARARRQLRLSKPASAHQRWSQARVVAELQRLAGRGVRLTNRGLSNAGHRGLANAARRYCGGLVRARLLAGLAEPLPLKTPRRRWSAEIVIDEILDRDQAGEPLAAKRVPRKLLAAGGYYLGNWGEAISAAGLDYDEIRLVRAPYDRQELLARLRDLAATRPAMTLAELYRDRAADAWVREFGSIAAAAAAADLDWPQRRLSQLLPRAATRRAIRARHAAGQAMHATAVIVEDGHLFRSAVRHFGTWEQAVKRAGLRHRPRVRARRWNEDEIRDALAARAARGEAMNPAALRADNGALYHAAKTRLGYNAAEAKKYGAPTLIRTWTPEEVVAELRAVTARGDKPRPGLKRAVQIHFGSMSAGRRAAGLPALRTEWDDERVIREISAWGAGDRRRASGTLISQAQKRFGSWRAAVEAAGVEPAVRPRWTEKEIRAALEARIAAGLPMNTAAVVRDDRSLYDAVRNRWGAFSKAAARLLRRTAKRRD